MGHGSSYKSLFTDKNAPNLTYSHLDFKKKFSRRKLQIPVSKGVASVRKGGGTGGVEEEKEGEEKSREGRGEAGRLPSRTACKIVFYRRSVVFLKYYTTYRVILSW